LPVFYDLKITEFKIDIRDFQVDYFLTAQSGQINQREHHSLFRERWRGKKLFKLLMVQ
jgi:hypothetical protein